ISGMKAIEGIKKYKGKTQPLEIMPAMAATEKHNTFYGFLLGVSVLISHFFYLIIKDLWSGEILEDTLIKDTLIETLGMEITSMDKQAVVLTMPVDSRTHQPAGFLHGGASVALAETAASIGALLNVDPEEKSVFGIEINANHIKSKKSGVVTAKAVPQHIGKRTMVWEINITDENEELICVSRCTIGVVAKRG